MCCIKISVIFSCLYSQTYFLGQKGLHQILLNCDNFTAVSVSSLLSPPPLGYAPECERDDGLTGTRRLNVNFTSERGFDPFVWLIIYSAVAVMHSRISISHILESNNFHSSNIMNQFTTRQWWRPELIELYTNICDELNNKQLIRQVKNEIDK